MLKYNSFMSTNGENTIITYGWFPEKEPIGVVQIVHGMQEHMGRYNDFAEFLKSKGFIVYGHDHIGHGKTALTYGMFGYFAKKQGAKVLVDDSSKFTNIIHEAHPNLPLFLLGHSMGSFITRLQILKDSGIINGYICMGSSDKNPAAPYLRMLAGTNAKLHGSEEPALAVEGIIKKAVHSKYLLKGEPKSAWISHDEKIVTEYMNDPMTQFYFTNAAYCDLMDLIIASTENEWYYRLDPLMPIFVVGGAEDPVGLGGKGLKAVTKKLDDLAFSIDVECKIYPNMRHEILNEINNMDVYYDILEWIDNRIYN